MSNKKTQIATSIVLGLDKLANQTSTVDKISCGYRDMQIEIVLEHLRKFEDDVKEKMFQEYLSIR